MKKKKSDSLLEVMEHLYCEIHDRANKNKGSWWVNLIKKEQ